MSVSDPLLKKLKGYIHQMRLESEPISDFYPAVLPFCETLEEIFRRGLREHRTLFGLLKKDYWNWIESLGSTNNNCNERMNPLFVMVVDKVKRCSKCNNNHGRGRYFLRLALQNKILSVPVEHIIKNSKLQEDWYDPYSIVGDEILHEILMSLLYEVTEINFNLCTTNASFLDCTWTLPIYKSYEFVPCRDLGLQVQFVRDRCIVSSVTPGSVAEEDNKIEAGDILEDMLGENLRGIKKGRMSHLLRQNRGFPVQMGVIKCRQTDGSVYPPIKQLLQSVGRETAPLLETLTALDRNSGTGSATGKTGTSSGDESDGVPIHTSAERVGYSIKYVGKVQVGQCGGVHLVEKAIETLLKKKSRKEFDESQCVLLELGETDIIVCQKDTKEVIMKHSYTEISSCGRRTDSTEVFAYLAGETTCTLAKTFVAHIFKANNEEESKTILCSIAQGFGRTHWFV